MIHPTAIIDEGAIIGENTNIWHWSHVCNGAKIGKECNIGQNVFISNKAVLGSNVKIQNNVSVYDMVFLEDYVFCGPSVVFTNLKNPRSHISRKDQYQKTIVRSGATIGANATIICGVEIGQYSFIGAGSVVTKNVKPFSLMVGVPAISVGWMSKSGDKFELPNNENYEWKCDKTGEIYQYNLETDMVDLITWNFDKLA